MNAPNGAGWTALHWACSTGQVVAVKVLLAKFVNTSIAPPSDSRCTPLAVALDSGYGDIVDLIDPSGSATERVRGQGWRSPFHACSFCGADSAQVYCGLCAETAYCNQRCADRHWKEAHRADCTSKRPAMTLTGRGDRAYSGVPPAEAATLAARKAPAVLSTHKAAELRLFQARNPAFHAAHAGICRMMQSSTGLSSRNVPSAWQNTGALDQLMADGNANGWREMHHQSLGLETGASTTST